MSQHFIDLVADDKGISFDIKPYQYLERFSGNLDNLINYVTWFYKNDYKDFGRIQYFEKRAEGTLSFFFPATKKEPIEVFIESLHTAIYTDKNIERINNCLELTDRAIKAMQEQIQHIYYRLKKLR